MKRIKELELKIKEASDAYYNSDQPLISDEEFDALVDELRELNPDHPALKSVGAPLNSPLSKVSHVIPMGSLFKINTEDEFRKWSESRGSDYVVQEKLDGLSVELVYEKGRFIQAITRGDGFVGEDITHNIRLVPTVPKKLPKPITCNVRGEIILLKSELKSITGYVNCRNAASGMSRTKDPNEYASKLTVFAFDLVSTQFKGSQELHKLKALKALGFYVVKFKRCDVEQAVKYREYYVGLRESLDHEIDGLVVKINDIKEQESLGVVDNRPKGQVAWKFAAESRRTFVKDITWEVGLTGRITPVAWLEPVPISGVTVTKATIHNVSRVEDLGVGIGSEVLVSRRGDVIPQIEKVISNPGRVAHPTDCPVCGDPTVFEGKHLQCIGPVCEAKELGNILKWIRVLDIDGIGPSTVKALYDGGLVKDPADLYILTKKDIMGLEGFKSKSASNILKSLEKAKKLSYEEFFGGLNIYGASTQTFSAIKKYASTVEETLSLTYRELIRISGVGDVVATNLVRSIKNKTPLIEKLNSVGVSILDKSTMLLGGKSFCFTGALSIPRSEAQRLVKENGGEVKSGVSKGLNFLVQANKNSTSSKSKKAVEYGTEVISEVEFMDMLGVNDNPLMSI